VVLPGRRAAGFQRQYLLKGAGMTRESTFYLLQRGIKVVGIDAWSWDRPLTFLAREFEQTGDAAVIWEAHFAGIEVGYCHMEKLANPDSIPRHHGFKVACLPIKIKGASAGWTRPVAIVED
jgi:kynurenine formamidase